MVHLNKKPDPFIFSPDGVCVPNFSPGLNFWDGTAQQDCGIASAKCVVVYEKGLIGGKKVVEGEECLDESWAFWYEMKNIVA